MNSPSPHSPRPDRSPSATTPSKPAIQPASASSPAISGAPTSPALGRSSSTLTTAAEAVAPQPTSPRNLASHGYVIAALDHSEVVALELAGDIQGFIANGVPDAGFLLDYISPAQSRVPAGPIPIASPSSATASAAGPPWPCPKQIRPSRLWSHYPTGGAPNPKPGIIPATLTFNWPRPPASLYIVAVDDVLTPINGMYELYSLLTPQPRQMVVLPRADHLHFVDNVEPAHEQLRTASLPPEAAWISRDTPSLSSVQATKRTARSEAMPSPALTRVDADRGGDSSKRANGDAVP